MLHSLLWLSLLLHYSSAEIASRATTHHADVLKLKCDALPYRTVFHRANCYFVIDTEPTLANSLTTANSCSRVLPGAKLVGEAPDPVWSAVEFPEKEFIRDGELTGKKRAMCLFESRFPEKRNSTTTKFNKCKPINRCGGGGGEKTKLTYILPLPWISKLKEKVTTGHTFIFKGMTYSSSQEWSINFHCNAATWTQGNDAPLHISFRHDMGLVRFLTFENSGWKYEDKYPLPDTLKNKPFEIRIVAHDDSFQMFINDKEFASYKLRLPMSSITRVSSMARIQFLDRAHWHRHEGFSDVTFHYVHMGSNYDPVPNESGITTTGFSYCKTLSITGIVEPHVPSMTINFNRMNETGTLQSQNAFHFYPRFDMGDITLNDVKNGQWGRLEFTPLPFKRGVPFNLTIANEPRGFVILANGKHYYTFPHRICPYDIITIWIGQVADLTATVFHSANCQLPKELSESLNREKAGTTCLRPEYRPERKEKLSYLFTHPIQKLKEKISPGQKFFFKGYTLSTSKDWTINFHCNAASWTNGNDAPLHISFRHDLDWVRFMTVKNGVFQEEERYSMPNTLKNKRFEITLIALEDSFQMLINNEEFASYKLRLPMSSILRVSVITKSGWADVDIDYWRLGEKYDPVPNESGIITTGFSYCKTMFITGMDKAIANRFQVNFMRKNATGMTYTQNALAFHPQFHENRVYISDVIDGNWATPQYLPMPFARGVPFNLTITNEPRGFVIVANGKHIATYAHRICPFDITSIWIGDLVDLTVEVSHATNCANDKRNC